MKKIYDKNPEDEKILHITKGYKVPETVSKQEAFDKLMSRIEKSEKPAKKRKIKRYVYISMAASILLLIGLFLFVNRDTTVQIEAANGTTLNHRLPDGTSVTLNAGSKIRYAQGDFTANRKLHLTGEAFFVVKKGEKFVISTPNGNVEILGTSLNVYSRSKSLKVSCLTGKVKVTTQQDEAVITAGESVFKQGQRLTKKTDSEVQQTILWQKGEFHYTDTPVKQVFDEIERQFNVTIQTKNIENRYFTGGFTNKKLEETLEIICIPLELKYDIQNNKKIIIQPKKE